MSKKKNPNPLANATLPVAAPDKAAERKPKAKANSQLKTTILSAPRTVKLDATQSFMRTTAMILQNKVKTAMTELSKVEKSNKNPSARLGLSYDSSIQTNSSSSFFSNPFNRFKIAFLTVAVLAGISGYFYSDRVIDGFKSLGDVTWVKGMMTQTNGVPEDNDKDGTLKSPRMMEETVMPVADETPAVAAPVAKAVAPEVKVTKGKAKSKAKVAKAKPKTKTKGKKSAQK
jgi:hypothetical protein